MVTRFWKRLGAIALGGCTALLIGAGTARAEDNELQDLKTRLEKLEKQNEYLQKIIESGVQPATGVAEDTKRVETIVNDYLKQADDKKKKEEEAKKKEAEAKGYRVGSDLVFRPSWRDGLNLATQNGDFRVHVGGRVHNDWVWFEEPNQDFEDDIGFGFSDGTFFRRARLQVDGTAYEVVDWVAEFDFAESTDIRMRDLGFTLTQLPVVGNFRAGHFKEPIGLEQLTSSRYITFIERSPVDDAFFPSRNPGFTLMNAPKSLDERATWGLGFFRNDPEDDGIDFGDGEYATTGRITVLPVWEHDGRCLVHLGGAVRYFNSEFDGEADVVRFRARPEFRAASLLPRFVDTGAFPADYGMVYGAEFATVMGPLSVQAEYVIASADGAVVDDVDQGDARFNGFYIYATYFLTGEHRAYRRSTGAFDRVRPHEPFFLVRSGEDGCGGTCCGKGAWELAARYSYIDLNDGDIEGGRLEDITLGVNWYLNPNFKVMWNYVYARREAPDNGAGDEDVKAWLMRLAFDF